MWKNPRFDNETYFYAFLFNIMLGAMTYAFAQKRYGIMILFGLVSLFLTKEIFKKAQLQDLFLGFGFAALVVGAGFLVIAQSWYIGMGLFISGGLGLYYSYLIPKKRLELESQHLMQKHLGDKTNLRKN